MPVKILYTGSVEKEFIVVDDNIVIEYAPLIELELSEEPVVLHQINSILPGSLVIITSQVAVSYLQHNLTKPPHWKIACMSGATLQLLEKIGWKDLVIYTADNALQLTEAIIHQENPQNVYFLTNTIRTASIPDILNEKGFHVNEVYVYHNKAITQKLTSTYDGIVFLSPSAVQNFFSQNDVDEKTIFFSIGATTATAIENFTSNKVIVAKAPTPKDIIDSIQQYYFSK